MTPQASLMGSFDDNFMVANEGMFYTADVSYTFKNVGKLDAVTPYAMYSSYDKSEKGFKNSSRNLVGVVAIIKICLLSRNILSVKMTSYWRAI